MPSASVIIPAYRAEKFIVRTVNSLLKQTFTDWEAIIVSDDNMNYQEFLSRNGIEDKRLRFGSTGKTGSGPSNARNIALDMAKSPIIATLDADDTFDKRKLEMMVPMAGKHGIAISNIRMMVDETNEKLPNIQYTPTTRLIKFSELLAANACGYSNIVYKKPENPIYWPTNVKYCEDLLFISKIYDYHGSAFYLRHELYNYYLHNDSLCRTQNATDHFDRDRTMLISMLKENEAHIKNQTTRDMLISFLQAGLDINRKHGKEIFSYERYLSELRKLCPFLPNANNWKL